MDEGTEGTTSKFVRDVLHVEDAPPAINARFFYTSPLAIDDPLSPVPPPLTGSSTNYKSPPRPFSEFDNAALEKSWLEARKKLLKKAERNNEEKSSTRRQTITNSPGTRPVGMLSRHNSLSEQRNRRSVAGSLGTRRIPPSPSMRPHRVPSAEELPGVKIKRYSTELESRSESVSSSYKALDPALASMEGASTTGNPFIRAPTRTNVRQTETRPRSVSRPMMQPLDSYNWGDDVFLNAKDAHIDDKGKPKGKPPGDDVLAKVPVGVSRIHNVLMPDLRMEPIYWAPVNDVAPVVRATWFYVDNMLPVEVDVANMLEAGYTVLRPWAQTWTDELDSAIEVGAEGEMKIVHSLWPEKSKKSKSRHDPPSRPGTSRGLDSVQELGYQHEAIDDPEKERQELLFNVGDIIDIAAGDDGADNKATGICRYGRDGSVRQYSTAGVIYADSKTAYILKPALLPSSYYGRRPLANYIRKDRAIGIKVVRGFDQAVWDKLYPQKKSSTAKKARQGVASSQAGIDPSTRQYLDPSFADSERPEVTDLVLVIHGIGQKLSERMESYHFTHAMNAFRREANVELGTDVVKVNLRPDMGGVMILPVNWRLTLSFEEGGYRDEDEEAQNEYTLKDITPISLPSVRGVVSDVLLDIPFYLSKEHNPKMLAAVTREANRIYRLWCSNNPGFEKTGRVHLIAHSLGSVMAIDILSNQPSQVPAHFKSPSIPPSELPENHFIFDVANLFTAGSPCGFFLLLKNASLRPRRDRPKPGADEYDLGTPGVASDQGIYGCLSVDNLYNVINPYDPVAYHMNACMDATYASHLKPATVPSANTSFFSNPFGRPTATQLAFPITKPTIPRLPSNVELETHDFTREEIAEKRAFLLNDNGQIDYLMKYGGGPLEIQYLTMLGAHSSYWLSKDFVRLVVQEIGRRSGKEGTLPNMRAVKKKGGPTPR